MGTWKFPRSKINIHRCIQLITLHSRSAIGRYIHLSFKEFMETIMFIFETLEKNCNSHSSNLDASKNSILTKVFLNVGIIVTASYHYFTVFLLFSIV